MLRFFPCTEVLRIFLFHINVTPQHILCWWCHTCLSRLLETVLWLWVRQVPFSILLNYFVSWWCKIRILNFLKKICFWKAWGVAFQASYLLPYGCDIPKKEYVKMMCQRRAENVGNMYSLDHPELIKVLY